MMKITGLSHLFKWENLHNWWLTKYFLAPLYILPCLHGCPTPQVASSGVGRPRVIIGTGGQYYILALRLTCKAYKRYWHADKPQWLEKLPKHFSNIVPAFLMHKKAICKSVMDELRRSGKSPEDMAKQLTEVLHLKYERAHLAYLLSVQNIRDAEAGVYGQRTITGLLRQTDTPAPFGGYSDADGWCGVSVSSHYLVSCLGHEYQRQKELLTLLLQGTFGQALRSDHTRKVARKVVLSSGTMSSYAIMNENWMILSWVMLQSEFDRSLQPGSALHCSWSGEGRLPVGGQGLLCCLQGPGSWGSGPPPVGLLEDHRGHCY
ncbi:uncharacterized protein LOC115593706 [Sparus aurata]|uniref:uncharacterized protein LOC115593706 n=1 Tax=Sparus aurata TaxID=8175 RepID=UPI0011C1A35A|nr:uncharacterized protein LOC115593706 [Sparus aurata]